MFFTFIYDELKFLRDFHINTPTKEDVIYVKTDKEKTISLIKIFWTQYNGLKIKTLLFNIKQNIPV